MSSNKYFAAYLALVAAALVAVCCHGAELPPAAGGAVANATPTAPSKDATNQIGTQLEQDDADDEMWLMGGDDEDYEGDYEDDYDMPESPEEDMADLTAEHSEVEDDCEELAQMIQAAKSNSSAPIDPDLQEAYDECKQDLADIESDMRELSADLAKKD